MEEDWDKFDEMDDLRIERPVLWAVLVMGPITPKNIASKLMIPPVEVLDILRGLKEEGLVVDQENPREGLAMVWEVTTALAELDEWRRAQIKDWNG